VSGLTTAVCLADAGFAVRVWAAETMPYAAYLLPLRDVVVLGGTASPGRWDRSVVARCVEIEPRLAGPPILEHYVGIRPARDPVRVERVSLDGCGAQVLHNYGHGNAGLSISWGCARYAVTLLG
jgi:D-amino-acid oxidase